MCFVPLVSFFSRLCVTSWEGPVGLQNFFFFLLHTGAPRHTHLGDEAANHIERAASEMSGFLGARSPFLPNQLSAAWSQPVLFGIFLIFGRRCR